VRVLRALAEREHRPRVVTVTNGLSNSLAGMADIALDTAAGEELGPSTMTFAGTLVLLRALARALGGNDADPEAEVRAAASVERLTAGAEAAAGAIGAWLGDRRSLVIVSRGHGRPAAEMGALTLKEAARFAAESMQTAQFRHGPLELASEALAAIVIAVERATLEIDLGLAAELTAAGAAVMVVSADGSGPPGAYTVATGELSPGLVSAAAIVPTQLLSWQMATDRGYDPGTYAVAHKVTTRE
jgi:glutamine---fructose-6-phosphate transaminase (isomerizing)